MDLLNFEIKKKNLFNKIGRIFVPGAQFSYSQFGEDIVLEYLFSELRIKNPTYLDMGANDPRIGSNTYKFYRRGSSGVLVEPDPFLSKKIKKIRPRDIILNIGVGFEEEVTESEYFQFPNWASGLNTFSKENATYWQEVGHKDFGKIDILKTSLVKLNSVNHILKQYFVDAPPNLISLDIEGLDLQILKTINFDSCTSEVICVETLGYDDKQRTFKRNDIISYLQSKAYMVFADTRVNTILCKSNLINS